MKKLLLTIVVLVLLMVAAVYLFIPSIVSDTREIDLKGNPTAINRYLITEARDNPWWLFSQDSSVQNLPVNDSLSCVVVRRSISSLGMRMQLAGLQAAGALHVLPVGTDSVRLTWITQVPTSYNPVRRWQNWRKAGEMNDAISARLDSIASFLSQSNNVYGFDIHEEKVVDSILVSTFIHSAAPASQEQVYSMVDQLRKFIAKHSARETGSPMVNTTQTATDFLIRVAIPVDRRLPNDGKISYKWMMGGGKILVAEVKGGNERVQQAFQQMENYLRDFRRTAPAIPFFSWVTDRRQQPDSSQWITRIYYPVM
jgi:hypothetical protein